MANQVRDTFGTQEITVVADRGYFTGEQIVDYEHSGIAALVPKPRTSGNKAKGFLFLSQSELNIRKS
jgi:hypothetical protein